MKTTKSESDELGPEYRRALRAGTLAAFVDSRRGAEGRRTHIPPRAPRPPAPRQRATTIEKTGDSEVGHGTLAGSLGVETRDSPNGCVCSSSLRGVTPCNLTLLDHSGKSITNVDRAHQLMLSFIEANRKRGKEITGYEYAVLVTNTSYEILSLGQIYRDRADAENAFDELKNQWGWGGYTTHDLHRCQLAARAVALIYNWWSLFVRLAHPEARREAITSRPWLMTSVGRKTEHAGQTTVTLTGLHAHFAQGGRH